MMRKSRNRLPQPVLIFNRARVLICITRSLRAASLITMYNMQGISLACLGDSIMYREYYFRYIHPNVEIEMDDLNVLKLEEYDTMCGIQREYYTIRQIMKRIRAEKSKKKE